MLGKRGAHGGIPGAGRGGAARGDRTVLGQIPLETRAPLFKEKEKKRGIVVEAPQ